ncbi:hypothetical protein [Streptomyces erythrochromogenes]|uniref:hypothetical protein n=1 Tax=Streptomyces erythrochromogenes TaxID=285574 RepID=UPI00369AD4FF
MPDAGAGTDHDPFQKPPSTRQNTTRQRRRRRRTLCTLPRTAIHNIVGGAATSLGMSLMGWIIWWIQQR